MKYKVGDKVKIKSLEWYNSKKNLIGEVDFASGPTMVRSMSELCGQIATISKVGISYYCLKEDKHHFYWAEEALEEIKTIDKTKLPLNIGDRVFVEGERGTIVAYYFDRKYGDYSNSDFYGYVIERDNLHGHNGNLSSFNEFGEEVEFKSERCWYYSVNSNIFKKINMKKSDLRPGMVIETRKGKKYLVIEVKGKLYYTSTSGYNPLSDYEEDLTERFEDMIIDKVYEISEASRLSTLLDESNIYLNLLWERPKQVELTLDEIANKFGISVSQLKIKK